jgi:hypothetical protein
MTARMGVVSGSDTFHLRSVRVCVPVFTGYPRGISARVREHGGTIARDAARNRP